MEARLQQIISPKYGEEQQGGAINEQMEGNWMTGYTVVGWKQHSGTLQEERELVGLWTVWLAS